jgi:hypothetical protein
MRPQRPCLDCGTLTRNPHSRCRPCHLTHQKTRNQNRTQYTGPWYAYSRRRRKEQPWCSICQTTQDLTVDHDTDQVMCRPCNSARRRNPT